SFSALRWLHQSCGPRQFERRCAASRHLRPPSQSTVSRCPRTLRYGGAALPDQRSGSQRESGIGSRPRTEDASERDALRKSRRSAGVSGSLGRTLGGYAYSWHDETAGSGHVRRRKTALAASASGTVPLLPIRRTRRSSGRLRGGGGRLLRLAARMDRTKCQSAMGCAVCAHPASQHQPTSSRAPAPETRRISHPGRRPPQGNAAEHGATLATRRTRWNPDRQALPVDLSAARSDRRPPHLGNAFPDQEIRSGSGRRRLLRRSGHRRCGTPLRAPLSGAPPAPANVSTADRSPDSRAHRVSRFHQSQNQGATKMNLIELNRYLRQLRLGGIAAVLETRLQQAQAEPMAPIDFLSCLVSDELTRRGDRLLERRRKQARFRDAQVTLDNFDFNFNKKMNRSLVFDLATATFIARREDALFLGPPGTGKSHLAQAIGQAVIGQGYRVIYREAHVLLEEIADAALDGKRKEHMELLATVPLLIIDDLGMRKLGPTAAEELLEIVMRRYERASTLVTSNRPVEDWGKLLGDSAAVTAMLDRLLHHGHILKCGPRS